MKQQYSNMRTPTKLHEALILFTIESYLTQAIKDGLTSEPFHKQIAAGINRYKTMRRFSKEESEFIIEIGKDEYMENLKKVEISFVVYALELLKLVAEEYKFIIGIGRKKLLKGRATFAISMLDLKNRDEIKYKELREIIDESVLTAKKFFEYTRKRIESRVMIGGVK